MVTINRRTFMTLLGAGGTSALLGGLAGPEPALAQTSGRVLVIGGGYGGATCASYLRRFGPAVEVTLIESNPTYYSCPFSNAVIAGNLNLETISFDYEGLRARGVKVVHDTATGIDPVGKHVDLAGGTRLDYDYLVISPGISFKWGEIENDQDAARQAMPHAYQAGPQTDLLRRQLQAMDDGGTVLIVPPPQPFRCPPGPYERASLIANYLKHNKPKSKVLIVDANETHSKKAAFHEGWQRLYPGMIEWIKGSEGGNVISVSPAEMTIEGEFGERYQGDVINLIPYQQAGRIVLDSGLANSSGWCDVQQDTFESQIAADVFILGDACVAGAMPRSGHAAASQAKNCAAVIVSRLAGQTPPAPTYANTCYSLLAPDYGISVAAVYNFRDGKIQQVTGGVTELEKSAEHHAKEAKFATSWFQSITADAFA